MDGERLSVTDATKLLPSKGGKRVHRKTVIRWINDGCRGIKLRAEKIGRDWFTSAEWIQEFKEACTARESGAIQVQVPSSRMQQFAQAELQRRYGYGQDGKRKVPNVSAKGEGVRPVRPVPSAGIPSLRGRGNDPGGSGAEGAYQEVPASA